MARSILNGIDLPAQGPGALYQSSAGAPVLSGPLPLAQGGTGGSSLSTAQNSLGIAPILSGESEWIGSVGGTANALTGFHSNTATLVEGRRVLVRVPNPNTGLTTFALNGGAAVEILRNGLSLKGGELQTGNIYELVYAAGNWRILNLPLSSSRWDSSHYADRRNTATQAISALTWTTVTLGGSNADTDAFFTSSTTITIPTGFSGKYLFLARVCFPIGSATQTYGVKVRLNTLSSGHFTQKRIPNGGALFLYVECTGVLPLSQGDTLDMQAYCSTGVTLPLPTLPAQGSRLQILNLGAE